MDALPKHSTALMLACRNGHVQHAQDLVEDGADVNESNWDFCTALHYACINKHAQCARLLIGAGADVNAVQHQGYTALRKKTTFGTKR
eukprot:3859196-Prymnesium_polylepis.1